MMIPNMSLINSGVPPERQKVMVGGVTLQDDEWGKAKSKIKQVRLSQEEYTPRRSPVHVLNNIMSTHMFSVSPHIHIFSPCPHILCMSTCSHIFSACPLYVHTECHAYDDGICCRASVCSSSEDKVH